MNLILFLPAEFFNRKDSGEWVGHTRTGMAKGPPRCGHGNFCSLVQWISGRRRAGVAIAAIEAKRAGFRGGPLLLMEEGAKKKPPGET